MRRLAPDDPRRAAWPNLDKFSKVCIGDMKAWASSTWLFDDFRLIHEEYAAKLLACGVLLDFMILPGGPPRCVHVALRRKEVECGHHQEASVSVLMKSTS